MNQFESREFIDELKRKNPLQVEIFIRHYTKILFGHVRKLGYSVEETDDIIQNTWITFFDVINKFENRSSIKTFLFGILYNKISEYRRKNIRLKSHEELDPLFDKEFEECFDQRRHWIKNPINPESFKMKAEVISIIEKCLELLPLKQKMAFILKEVEEEDTSIICNELDVSVTNLGVLLFRARNQLRICVESKERGRK